MGKRQPCRDRDEVRQRLAELVAEIARVPSEDVHEDITIANDLNLESVAFVELQVAIEAEYGIEIDPIMVVELNRMGDVVDYIASLPATAR